MQHVISPVTHSHPDAVRSTGLCVPLVAEASKPDPKAKEGNYNVRTRSDDLLLYWAELMKVPELASGVRQHFDHGLVAENQDNNPFQAAILLGLKSDGAGVPASAVEIDMRQCRAVRPREIGAARRGAPGGGCLITHDWEKRLYILTWLFEPVLVPIACAAKVAKVDHNN